MTSGLPGSSARSPIDWTGCLSKSGVQVVPAFIVFHTPPDAEPT